MAGSISIKNIVEPRGIAVWTVAVENIPRRLFPGLEELLCPAEKARAARFRFESDRQLYLAAHALKRLQLSAMVPRINPISWRFAPGPWGKPEVIGVEAVSFNLAHSRGLVACAVSRTVELGLDVEFVAPQAPMEVAPECFTPGEQLWVERASPRQRPSRFFRLWTLKEAVLKATGRGLYQSPRSFSFDFDPLRVSIQDPSLGMPSQWHFSQHMLVPDNILAVAWRGDQDEASLEVSRVKFQATA